LVAPNTFLAPSGMGLDDLIMKDVLPEANGLELPFRVARGARLLGLVRLMER